VRRDAKASSAGSTSGQGRSLGSFVRGAFAIRGASKGADGSGARSARLVAALALAPIALLALSASPALAATPPVINASMVTEVGATEASLSAKIVPGEAPTTYRVEYGPTTAYGQSTTESESIGADNTEHAISPTLEGLAPESTYHLRIVATNSVDTTNGPDLTIVTFAAGIPLSGLPDGRAYEQATGPDKGGANIGGQRGTTAVSPDGNSMTFFDLVTLPGSVGAQEFGTYLARRSDSDWSTQGLLPPASQGKYGRLVGIDENLSVSYTQSRDVNAAPGHRGLFYERDSATGEDNLIARGSEFQFDVATPDGSRMLFESAEPLAPNAIEGESNLFVWERSSQTIHLASVMNDGESPSGGAYAGPEFGPVNGSRFATEAFSPDGESVAFTTIADGQLHLRTHLLSQQSQLNGQEECTEPAMACTFEASASQASTPDPNGPQAAQFVGMSGGELPDVFFTSRGELTDDANTGLSDEGEDLYRFDSESGTLTDLTADADDAAGAEVIGVVGIGGDGKRAYFVANAVLGDGAAHGASSGDCEVRPLAEGECNLYYWSENGGVTYVARLDANAHSANGPQRQSYSDRWNWYYSATATDEAEFASRLSRDGSSLVFRSQLPQTAEPTGGVPNFYRFDAAHGSVQCLTCDLSGAAQPESPKLNSYIGGNGGIFSMLMPHQNLSSDGNRFFFESGARLSSADTNGIGGCPIVTVLGSAHAPRCQDVYEWEAEGTGSCNRSDQSGGCLFLISTGTDENPSFFTATSSSGDDAFIYTSQQLVTQDRDQLVDVYDARVDGGLPSQNPPPPNPCRASESCRGPIGGAPEETTPGSATFIGPVPSGPPKTQKCKKGFKRVKRRGPTTCVKSKKGKGGPKRHHKGGKRHSGGAK